MMQRAKAIEKRCEDSIEEKSKLLKNIEKVEDLAIKPQPYYKDKLIDIVKLSVLYDGKKICKEVTFDIKNGDRIAIKGANGSGKSSILKLVKGNDISFTGELFKGNNIKISYVSQDVTSLYGTLQDFAQENVIDLSLFKTILRKLDFSRVQFDKDIKDFSFGQKKKVLIAKSLSEEANLYLWDEPLNYIDIFSRIQIEDLILKHKPTTVFVEHDAKFIKDVATKIIEVVKE
jgi:lincosamide and streptogramin A transport system ATP-binding/permease protein